MLILAILLSFVHDVFDKVFVEADLRIVNGGKVLDKVSFRVNNQAVSPQVFFAHLTPMHQSLDVIHVTVVLHRCLVHLFLEYNLLQESKVGKLQQRKTTFLRCCW